MDPRREVEAEEERALSDHRQAGALLPAARVGAGAAEREEQQARGHVEDVEAGVDGEALSAAERAEHLLLADVVEAGVHATPVVEDHPSSRAGEVEQAEGEDGVDRAEAGGRDAGREEALVVVADGGDEGAADEAGEAEGEEPEPFAPPLDAVGKAHFAQAQRGRGGAELELDAWRLRARGAERETRREAHDEEEGAGTHEARVARSRRGSTPWQTAGVLTPDDFVLHRALGGDVVRELEAVWSPGLRATLGQLFLREGVAPDPSAADALVARVGAATTSRLREEISAEAFRTIHEAVTQSRARDLTESVRAAWGAAAACLFGTVALGALWLRGGGNALFGFLLCGGVSLPVVWLAVAASRRRRRLTGEGVRGF